MFRRILIANRGEIACRIAETCHRLGVDVVAVASDADAGARHARMADRVIALGGAAPAESYLDGERILAAAREAGCEAIHPGYGFLAENAGFARAVGDAGLVFIGPLPDTIAAMGSKSDAKRRMEAAGVPVVPGYHGEVQDEDTLRAEAARIGYPVLIKAAAGGGGKGMRIAGGEDEFADALASARREAKSAFGDDEVILERFVAEPRHIEVQVFADAHGNAVHLFERDCSAQRRYQKIIEFAPALTLADGEPRPLDDALRAKITTAAIDAARAVNYRGAGTVEFLLEPDGHFWFMEMNTRLQVEHPVTECITGLDLVEWQLRVAAGEPLPLAQDEIGRDGFAVEARLYAENPEAGFLPSTGRIDAITWPRGENVRVDTGVEAGDAISVHYDPMIAKLVVHAPTPAALFERLEAALAGTAVFGPHTNLRFLQRLAARLRARSGLCETTWVDREAAELAAPPSPRGLPLLQAAAAEWRRQDAESAARAARSGDPRSPWAAGDGWRIGERAPREARLALGDARWRLAARVEGDRFVISGDAKGEAEVRAEPGGRVTATAKDGTTGTARCHRHGPRLVVSERGDRYAFEVLDPLAGARDAAVAEHDVLAPMPGKVIEVKVSEGDAVTAGQALVLLEAMKMELTVRAPRDAVVGALPHGVGDFVEADTVLAHFEEGDA